MTRDASASWRREPGAAEIRSAAVPDPGAGEVRSEPEAIKWAL